MLILVISLILCGNVESLKCFQCTSLNALGCFSYNLNKDHLKECANNTISPICRSISQVQYFTPSQDVVILRECAYVYEEPLQCTQSKFSGLHYSLSCECRGDGCNKDSTIHATFLVIALALFVSGINKLI